MAAVVLCPKRENPRMVSAGERTGGIAGSRTVPSCLALPVPHAIGGIIPIGYELTLGKRGPVREEHDLGP